MIHGFLKNLLSSIWKREMSKLIKREGMIANVRKTQDDNKLQDDNLKRDKCIMCGAFHDLDDCSVFMSQTVQSQTKVLFKNECCYGCYVYIGPVSSKDHGNCARKNIQLAYMDSNLRKYLIENKAMERMIIS